MATWKHPMLGPIDIIPLKMRPKKVWQHFYDAAEHWERICDQDVEALRSETEAILGVRRVESPALPQLSQQRWPRGRGLLLHHHDAGYAPTYLAEMASTEASWTPTMDSRYRHQALTPRSVFVVVQLDQQSWVVTAYRPHPPTRGVGWDEADFQRHGLWYFRKETGMDIDSLARSTAENLNRTSTAPGSLRELWWLASAVGYGRLLADRQEVRAALPVAEAALGATREVLRRELATALDWDDCLGRIARGLKEDRSEDLEDALAASEELLAAASVIDTEEATQAFCASAEELLAWLPPEWSHMADIAAARCRVFGGSEGAVFRLWTAVEAAAVGAAIREASPAMLPRARFVDELIPADPGWLGWRDRIAAFAGDMSTALGRWLQASLDSVSVVQPAPALGSAEPEAEPWEVRGRPAPNAPHFRIFVVDEEHPDGHEVTERFTQADGDLWRIDHAGDRALVVIVAGESPIPGTDLESVLAHAAENKDVLVVERTISPPT